MFVNAHARARLRERLGPVTAGGIIADLETMPGEAGSVAIEVATWTADDRVVVIARGGEVTTVMLRRARDQSFTPAAMHVDRVVSLTGPRLIEWKETGLVPRG